jgi:glutaredoxin-related protein
MPRPILEEARLHPAIRARVAGHHRQILEEVGSAIASNAVVVVGMAMNPFPAKARKALAGIGQPYRYLEYGSYFNSWRKRNALKMWTGWPTFPMVFVRGTLIGGAAELEALIASGELKKMLDAPG